MIFKKISRKRDFFILLIEVKESFETTFNTLSYNTLPTTIDTEIQSPQSGYLQVIGDTAIIIE